MKRILYLIRWLRLLRTLKLRSFFLFLLASVRSGRTTLRVPFLNRDVTIRGKTSDVIIFDHLLVQQQYKNFTALPARTIIDAGANIGCAALWFSHLYPDAEIVCLEPDDDNHQLTLENVLGLRNVVAMKAGLWGSKKRLRIANRGAWNYALQVEEADDGPVLAYSVGAILRERNWSHVDILKIDIEGSEVSVLAENVDEWIHLVNVLIIELHQDEFPEGSQLLCAALAKQHFHIAWGGENLVATRRPLLKWANN